MIEKRKWIWVPVVLTLVAAASRPAVAQEPVVVMATKSVDGLISDLKYMFTAGGQNELGDIVDGWIDQATQGKGLQGINRTKPAGAYMSISGAGTPDLVVFVPVDDIKAFRDLIATFMPKQAEVAGGIFKMQGDEPEQLFYGKYQNGYCYLSMLPTALAKLPDPAKFAKTQYALSVVADMAKLPDESKEQILEKLQEAIAPIDPVDVPKPADNLRARVEERTEKVMLDIVRLLVKQSDKLTFGLDIDQKSKTMGIDLSVSAKSGTQLSQSIASYAKTTSAFAGIAGPESVASLVLAMPVSKQMRDVFRDAFRAGFDEARAEVDKSEKLKTDQQKKVARDVIDRVAKVVEATADTGRVDGSIVFNPVGEDKLQLVAAGTVVNGNEVAKVIDDAVKQNPNDPGLQKLSLDVAKHGGARIHAIEVELHDERKAQFGDGPAHLGIRDDALYFAVGGDSLAAVKAAIDKTGKADTKRAPVSARFQPSKLIGLTEQNDDDPRQKIARDAFRGDGDYISFELLPAERGTRLRLEFGEGFIRFLGTVLSGQMGG
jgi:hypothetical protein